MYATQLLDATNVIKTGHWNRYTKTDVYPHAVAVVIGGIEMFPPRCRVEILARDLGNLRVGRREFRDTGCLNQIDRVFLASPKGDVEHREKEGEEIP